jgi:molybdate transport system substrate-binding protein
MALSSRKVNKIAIANPAVAPYGRRAVECLRFYHLYDLLSNKIVKGENVSQAAQFLLTGNAEVGIIALSLALSPEMKSKGKYFLLDEKSYSGLEQAYVVMKNAAASEDVKRFIRFQESKQARQIFRKFGFRLPGEN